MRALLKIFAILCLLVSVPAKAFLRPATQTADAPTNDPFLIYQWPLFNRGQSINIKIDDNSAVEVHADPKVHLNWRNFDALMKRDVKVAVLDSGVDMDHPELKKSLLKGLNLLARGERDKTFVDDDKGHGTHMASILAASSHDGKGMSGLSNRIKIVPVKVYDSKERPSAQGRKALMDRVIQALDFAISEKVDVINLSMGWPRAKEGKELEEAFRRTLDAGIVIVAGSGNDGHEAMIYPCAYRGVICVGSVDIDGQMSNFSNFGGHVDLLAPGQSVLGLWPTTEDVPPPMNFGPRGYEILSGVSQATPMVAATAAILKGIYPHESGARIRRRILQSATRVLDQHQYTKVNFGLLNMQAALDQADLPFAAPVFKVIELAVIDPQTRRFELPVEIEVAGVAQTPKLQVESLTEGVHFSGLRSLGPNRYLVTAQVQSLDLNNRLRYRVIVNDHAFEHQILMAVDVLRAGPKSIPLPAGRLLPVVDLRGVRQPQFWSFEESDEGALGISVWRFENEKWIRHQTRLKGATHFLPEIGMGLMVGDWLGDGREIYLLAAKRIAAENGTRKVLGARFFYLNQELKVERQFVVDDMAEIPAFRTQEEILMGRVSDGQGAFVQVPVFWRDSAIPEADRNPDFFSFEKNTSRMRPYFLQPVLREGVWKFESRTLDSWRLTDFFRKSFNLDSRMDVNLIGMKVQGLKDLRAGRLRALVFVGRGVAGRAYELTIEDLLEGFNPLNTRQIQSAEYDLQRGSLSEAWTIGTDRQVDRLTEIRTLYSLVSGRSLLEDGLKFNMSRFQIPSGGEKIVSTLKSVVRGQDRLVLFETSDYIRAQGIWKGQEVDSKVSSYRSTFLPGHLFSQIYVPVLVGSGQNPGVMMDNSQFFSRSVSVYSLGEGNEMHSPIRLSFQIPDGCTVGSRLALWNEHQFSQMMLRCEKPGTKGAQLLLVNLE